MSKIKLSVLTLLLVNFFVFSQIIQADGVTK